MLIAAAVCPHPPLLVPDVAQGAAAELDGLRDVCRQVIDGLYRAQPDRLVLVGGFAGEGVLRLRSCGSFNGFGVDLAVDLRLGSPGSSAVPLSLLVAGWLLRDRPALPLRSALAVGDDTPPQACLEMGERVAHESSKVAMLVMGDGSARHTQAAPGYIDERAVPYDAGIERALREADAQALAKLDPVLARELLVAGRPAWQVLAGAALASGSLAGAVYDSAAPYGVGYHVALWTAAS